MSKSKLRQEYENVMGVVTGALRLYDAKGKTVYYESANGWWARYEYDDDGQHMYYVDSDGMERRDNRPKQPKLFTDENGVQYKLTEVTPCVSQN